MGSSRSSEPPGPVPYLRKTCAEHMQAFHRPAQLGRLFTPFWRVVGGALRVRAPRPPRWRGAGRPGGQGAWPGRCHEGRPLSESAHITVTVTCLPPWSQRPQSQHQLSGPERSTQCTCREGTVCHATGRPALAGRRLTPSASSAARPCSREEGRGSPRGGGLRLRPPVVPATPIAAEARGGWVPTVAEGARSLMVAEAVRAAAWQRRAGLPSGTTLWERSGSQALPAPSRAQACTPGSGG